MTGRVKLEAVKYTSAIYQYYTRVLVLQRPVYLRLLLPVSLCTATLPPAAESDLKLELTLKPSAVSEAKPSQWSEHLPLFHE